MTAEKITGPACRNCGCESYAEAKGLPDSEFGFRCQRCGLNYVYVYSEDGHHKAKDTSREGRQDVR